MKTLSVNLVGRSYPIFIGEGLLFDASLVTPYIKGTQVLIVTNKTVAPLYLDQVKRLFADFVTHSLVLEDGEAYKNLHTVTQVYDALLNYQFDRQCTLVALGGGVIGDITGFAAASYQRGVNFIQIPTTLLSQVDSSVGGKTGVNHPKGKNMIGAFYQPKCVLADLDTLSTLEPRQISAGLAEIIKYGLINDAPFFDWLETHVDKILALDASALSHAVLVSCDNKAKIVVADERESGIRATLNLGHTFGHAIEAHMGYGEWLHGEAVAVGLVLACDLSSRLGMIDNSDVIRTSNLIKKAGLPIAVPTKMGADDFLTHMTIDKKVEAGQIKLILLEAIGHAKISVNFDQEALIATLSQYCQNS